MKALLLGLIGAYCHIDWCIGTPFCNRPLILGPLVGLVLGDLEAGIKIGASLEIFFLGSMAIGSYIPPDAGVGGILGTAFAIEAGLGADVALTMAIPIAIIATSFQNVLWSINSLTTKIADKFAAKGQEKGIYAIMWLEAGLNTLLKAGLVYFAWAFGSEKVVDLLGKIPNFIIKGMTIANGILPAIGFAMLMRMIVNRKVVVYWFLGFLLTAYLNVSTLFCFFLAVIIVAVKFDFTMVEEVAVDDDF